MNIKLANKIEKYKNMTVEELAEKFNCKPSEICMGDYIAKNTNDKVCPYKVILGFANFEDSDVASLGKLEIVFGKKLEDVHGDICDIRRMQIYLGLNLKNSKIKNLKNLKIVYGTLMLNEYITTLENMEFLGSGLTVINLNLQSFGNVEVIDGTLSLEDDAIKCLIKSLCKVKKIRKLVINTKTLEDFGDLEEVKELIIKSKYSKELIKILKQEFLQTDRRFVRKSTIKVDY